MGIPILVRRHLCIETAPWSPSLEFTSNADILKMHQSLCLVRHQIDFHIFFFSIPNELSVYIEHLQTSLGIDCLSSRVQRHLWSSLKHPHPYSSQEEAEIALEVLSLCQKMSLHLKSVQHDALVACHANSRGDFLQMALRVLVELQKCSPEKLPGEQTEKNWILKILQ